jgi:hypothetical protein
VRKLAIVLLLAVSACQRPVSVTTAPGPNAPGAANGREAVSMFLAAAKAQDLQAFANIWGTTEGPARTTMGKEELEQREIILLCFLKHDSYRVMSDRAVTNNERMYTVELKFRELTKVSNFFTTAGPAGRWYVRQFETEPLQQICQRR